MQSALTVCWHGNTGYTWPAKIWGAKLSVRKFWNQFFLVRVSLNQFSNFHYPAATVLSCDYSWWSVQWPEGFPCVCSYGNTELGKKPLWSYLWQGRYLGTMLVFWMLAACTACDTVVFWMRRGLLRCSLSVPAEHKLPGKTSPCRPVNGS